MFQAALAAREDDPASETTLTQRLQLVDFLRRTGRWEDAAAEAQGLIDTPGAPGHFRRAARLSKRFAEKRDDGRHTLDASELREN